MNVSEQIFKIFEKKLPNIFGDNSIRQNQIQMALDVAKFLFVDDKKVMFLEAPVGTGKSLGVLVPALLFANLEHKRVNYATATINLQNQIITSEANTLKTLEMCSDRKIILALGKSHYLCRGFYEFNRVHFSEDEQRGLDLFFENTETGFVDEFLNHNNINVKKLIKYAGMESLDKESRFIDDVDCPGHEHRRLYNNRKIKLLVTNQDQLIQSFFNYQKNERAIFSVENSVIIFDEAQFTKERFLGRLEKTVSLRDLKHWLSRMENRSANSLIRRLEKFDSKCRQDFDSNIGEVRRSISERKLFTALYNIFYEFEIKISVRNDQLLDDISKITDVLKMIMETKDNKSWVQISNEKTVFHSVTNAFISKFRNFINAISASNKIIFMSGTLTTGGQEKDISKSWYVEPDSFLFKSYPSTFNLSKQVLAYIPENIDVRSNNHLRDTESQMKRLVDMDDGGGTLILCTSNEYVFELAKFLKQKTHKKVYVQDSNSSIQKLSDSFKKEITSVLIGSGSFFTGFSAKGKTLSKLLITKLPYPTPNDPFIDLLADGMSNSEKFDYVITPYMLMKLEQGMGRLIRDSCDYGIIVIGDSRLYDNRRKPVLKYLQSKGYIFTDDFSKLEEFISDSHPKTISEYNRSEVVVPTIQVEESRNNIRNTMSGFSPESPWRGRTIVSKTGGTDICKKWLKKYIESSAKDKKKPRVQYRSLRSPKEIFQKAVDLSAKYSWDVEYVYKSFPYKNEHQRNELRRVRPRVSAKVKITKIQ